MENYYDKYKEQFEQILRTPMNDELRAKWADWSEGERKVALLEAEFRDGLLKWTPFVPMFGIWFVWFAKKRGYVPLSNPNHLALFLISQTFWAGFHVLKFTGLL